MWLDTLASWGRTRPQHCKGTKRSRPELIDPKIAAHNGRLVKTTGDGFLAEFSSVVNALRCAVEIQREMPQRNAVVAPDRLIEFRIGINVGDGVVEDGDIFGDGVNIEGLAPPGGIWVLARDVPLHERHGT